MIRKNKTDLAMVAFTEIDRVQHFFWNCMHEEHPTHNEKKATYKNAIRDVYKNIDRHISELLRLVGPDTRIIVYSDHGANAILKDVYLNTWLVEKGFMSLRGTGSKDTDKGRVKIKLLDRKKIETIFKRFGLEHLIHKIPKSLRKFVPREIGFHTVDWANTRVYFSSFSAQSICVNLKGREPEGCVKPGKEYDHVVDEVVEALKDLKDPEGGRSPIKAAHKRSDLYDGPFCENAPDIVLVPAEGYVFHKEFADEVFKSIGNKWEDRSSDHERQGIVYLMGPGIKKGHELKEMHIEDIAPTILYLCGIEVPGYMDGQVMEDAFEESWLKSHPVEKSGDRVFKTRRVKDFEMTSKEEALLKERLKGLGYLG
jgi:predicted AlkP superfamily phosphohydrolase/phosphomutase